jgi:alkylation response protein AidB-like acyl-CoA dehydrogenase
VIFQIDKSQQQIEKAVDDFARGEFKKEVVAQLAESRQFPEKIWKKACHLGFVGIHFPESFGGEGLGMVENVLVTERLCRADSSVGACVSRAGYATEFILRFGNESQKKKWLPKVAQGKIITGGAFLEPGDDDPIGACGTTAVKEGNEWVINGVKSFVLNAGPLCGVYVVLCNTGEADSDNHLSTFLVEADRAGVTVADAGPVLGLRSMRIGTVGFEQVRVPLDHLVGSENAGRAQVLACRSERRIQAAAELLGIAVGAFERAFQHVAQREQFRRKIIDFQVTRQKLGDMATRIQAARLLTYQAASSLDQGGASEKLSAMAKLQATRTALVVCDEAVQLLGGYGYVQEYEVERFFRDARALGSLDGTQIAQKNIIAEGIVKAKGSLSIL